MFYQEQEQYVLMIPILLGLGVGVYFSGYIHLDLLITAIFSAVAFIVAILIGQKFPFLKYMILVVVFICAGYCLASYRVISLATVTLDKELKPTNITGTVQNVHMYDDGKLRLTLRDTVIRGTDPLNLVNVRVNKFDQMPYAGDKIEIRAGLMPPPRHPCPVIMIMQGKYGSKV